MIRIALGFLCLVLFSFPTIAQDNCHGKVIPWKASIAGYTDSITVEAIVAAGKIKCSNQAFEIINFKIGFVTFLGCYSEVKLFIRQPFDDGHHVYPAFNYRSPDLPGLCAGKKQDW